MQKQDEAFNILFTSVGRRVALIRHFQNTLKELGLNGKIVGVDVSHTAPAFHVVDKAYQICRIDDQAYIPTLVELCKKERITLLFPLIDTDLLILSESRQRFAAVGTTAVVSDPDIMQIACNKYKTHNFFVAHDVDTPKVFTIEDIRPQEITYPVFIKPQDGSASIGIFKVNNQTELLFFKDYVKKPILQEFLQGREITLDILFDFNGVVRCVVPRMRIEVRAGEVSKAVIIDNRHVMEEGWRVGSLLQGCRGCINVQCFLTDDNKVKFIEINPRFGGGVPLSISAGADFPKWIIEIARGNDPGDIRDAFKKNMYMLRYDDAIFLDGLPSNE